MKRIKLVCMYDMLDSKFKRRYILAATTKIDYIVASLNSIGYSVDIISAAEAEGGNLAFSKTKTINLGCNTLTLFGCCSLYFKRLSRNISVRQVVSKFEKYCKNNICEGDIVIAYHSPRYASFFKSLRNEVNFTLIGEIEEIYQDVHSMGYIYNQAEYEFFKICDKYIFPTGLLNDKLNYNNDKKSIIIHGLYNIVEDLGEKFDDNKIHVVYAGTFDLQKGGAAAAAAAAVYLPENYHIHICGFGSEEATIYIKEIIEETQKTAKAKISFEGLLSGEEFIRFIQKCEIGLSTQNPDAAFNATSFPSKILNYLSNGLKVVTIDIPAIRQSDVGNYLFYYNSQTPENIACAIVEAHGKSGYDGRSLLRQLDMKFQAELNQFLN